MLGMEKNINEKDSAGLAIFSKELFGWIKDSEEN